MLKKLSQRSEDIELMDNFKDGISELKVVLKDINRVNRVLGGNSITINAVLELVNKYSKKEYVIVDVGCAEGAMLRQMARVFRKQGIKAKFVGVDFSKEALILGREASKDFAEIEFLEEDVLKTDLSYLNIDIAISTLTYHHFTDDYILKFTNHLVKIVDLGIVVNDLHRSSIAYYLFKLFRLIYIKTKTAKIDGLISISRGFVKSDIVNYASKIPLVKHSIKWKWAFRYVWVMEVKRL